MMSKSQSEANLGLKAVWAGEQQVQGSWVGLSLAYSRNTGKVVEPEDGSLRNLEVTNFYLALEAMLRRSDFILHVLWAFPKHILNLFS